ncbi:MAG TPA: hypothetical protein PKM43_03075 [Verrucomicrobiota bacterium]|nr:hypothetical protein [Verrucomicrobiota bacterium]HRZ35104.1 hypothetical protein [Candidatus Paceibacterota bacterium]HRZ54329.1 hypothetical protein [Candidatus Paceibacterota bacterium]
MSGTPFYIHGSGYLEGSPFPWIVSDFGLVDAIESGITKIPRLPAIDNTGRPDPKYFKLWEHITRDLKTGERLTGGKPKPEVVYRKAEDALLTLAGEWRERFDQFNGSQPGLERTPPVMIVVCDNTHIAEHFHRMISGEQIIEADTPDDGVFLLCAVDGQAHYLVSKDKALKDLRDSCALPVIGMSAELGPVLGA